MSEKNNLDPEAVATAGEQIYKEHYQALYEKQHTGEYVVIDVTTNKAYVATFPEDAMHAAKKDFPEGIFYLIKIGSPAAFKVSHSYASRHR